MIFFARTKPSKLNKKFPNFNGLAYRQKTTAKNKDSFVFITVLSTNYLTFTVTLNCVSAAPLLLFVTLNLFQGLVVKPL